MRHDELYVADLVDSARAVREYLDGVSREHWDEDRVLRDAVLYRLLLLGEIASALPDALRDRYPDVAWRQIRAFRNLAVHKYFSVDWAVVWQISREEVPVLEEQAMNIMRAESPELATSYEAETDARAFLRRAVTEIDGAVAEPALFRQCQVQADQVRQGPRAAAHDGRDGEQLVLVHQPGRDGLGGEMCTAHGEVAVGRFLQLADLVRVEVPLDAGPGAVRRLERGGVHDLVGGLPDLREVERDGTPARDRMRGLPGAHCLVHPPSVEICADRTLQVVDECVHFLVRRRPVKVSVRVGDVAVERHDGRVDQPCHASLLQSGLFFRPRSRGEVSGPRRSG